MKAVLKRNETVLALLFLVIFIGFSVTSKHFFKVGNIMNLFAQMVELGLLVLAMSASMISGGMDLSIGMLASFGTVLLAVFISTLGMTEWTAILFVLAISLACGMLNGYLVGYLKITAMLVTLGTQSLFMGIGLVVSNGQTIAIKTGFELFGRYKIFGVVPFQIVIYMLAISFSIILFNYTMTGRRIYMIGTNTEVARFAGISLRRNLFGTYVFSAFMSFLAALVIASRVASGRADVAGAKVLQAVCAAVFGGVSTMGGVGTVGGAVLGVAIITLISNGMDMLNISQFIQQIVTGAMLLVVLALRRVRAK